MKNEEKFLRVSRVRGGPARKSAGWTGPRTVRLYGARARQGEGRTGHERGGERLEKLLTGVGEAGC